MDNVKVKLLYKNSRYRIILLDSEYYLIDLDKSIVGYVFFMLNWFVPQIIYKIDERTADDLIVQRIDDNDKKNLSWIKLMSVILVFNIVIPSVINSFNNTKDVTYNQLQQFGDNVLLIPPWTYAVSIMISLLIPVLSIRIFFSLQEKKKMLKKVDYAKLCSYKIKIKPISMINNLKNLTVYIFFSLFLIIASILSVLLEGYWLISLCFTMIALICSMTNRLYLSASNYKIRFIKEK